MEPMVPIDVGRIEDAVKRTIDSVGNDFRGKGRGNKAWTRELKSQLSALAKADFGYEACGTGCHDGPEWLYDLIWLHYQPSVLPNCPRIVRDVPLALESEWNRDGILYDFQKLIISRAHLRVMVFETERQEQTDAKVAQLCEAVRGCAQSQSGDRYLFATWQTDRSIENHRFVFTSFTM